MAVMIPGLQFKDLQKDFNGTSNDLVEQTDNS